MKILVVDNDINISGLIKSVLGTEATFEADFAFSGKEGLEKMASNKPDVVLADLNMPEVSGFDMCKAMEADENLKTIPVIIISAMPINSKDFQESHGNFQNLSVVKGLLEKPFDFKSLLIKIKEVTNRI